MSDDNENSVSPAKKEYIKILLQQYSEAWQSIRNDSNSVWQIPTLLITTISVLGVAFAQLRHIQAARILILLLGLGFTLVSLIALVKHRFFCVKRTEDFNEVQRQLKWLVDNNDEFTSFFKKINNKILKEEEKIHFKEIKFKSKELAKDRCCIYQTSAYYWQRGLTISILIGIVLLLAREFVLLVHA